MIEMNNNNNNKTISVYTITVHLASHITMTNLLTLVISEFVI